jgi:hypothetical protein
VDDVAIRAQQDQHWRHAEACIAKYQMLAADATGKLLVTREGQILARAACMMVASQCRLNIRERGEEHEP